MSRVSNRFLLVSASSLLIGCWLVGASGQSPGGGPFGLTDPGRIGDNALLVARIESTNSFVAYSKHTGKWTTHKFPKGVVAVPVVMGNCAAFQLEGEEISEIVAVDRNGEWRTTSIKQKTNRCDPVIDVDVAAIQIGEHIYAFSATKGTWDAVNSSASPRVNGDIVMVVTPERISAFSAQTGVWAESPPLKP